MTNVTTILVHRPQKSSQGLLRLGPGRPARCASESNGASGGPCQCGAHDRDSNLMMIAPYRHPVLPTGGGSLSLSRATAGWETASVNRTMMMACRFKLPRSCAFQARPERGHLTCRSDRARTTKYCSSTRRSRSRIAGGGYRKWMPKQADAAHASASGSESEPRLEMRTGARVQVATVLYNEPTPSPDGDIGASGSAEAQSGRLGNYDTRSTDTVFVAPQSTLSSEDAQAEAPLSND